MAGYHRQSQPHKIAPAIAPSRHRATAHAARLRPRAIAFAGLNRNGR
jgi:hypothetical protein